MHLALFADHRVDLERHQAHHQLDFDRVAALLARIVRALPPFRTLYRLFGNIYKDGI